jgi:hypothetical protein
MRPARIIAAVVLTAAAAATGSYAAYSTSHHSAAASATTAAPTTTAEPSPSPTDPTTRVTASTPGTRNAACSSGAILPLLKRKFDNPSGELAIVRADIKRCRNGYAHVFAISRHNPPGHPQYENEQLFLRDVNGAWQSVAEGTGIACSDADITAAMLRACRALDYPTHTPPAPTPRISDPVLAARHLFDAWQAGDRQRALQAASPAAVRTLLAIAPSPQPRFSGCRSRSFGFDCVYAYPDANGVFFIDMRVEGGASAGYRVVAIDAPLRFANPQTSAKHLVDAWLAGDRAEARKAASATAVDALFRLGDRRHPPTFTGCTDRSLGFDCTYTSQGGGALTMRVTGGASVGWTVQTVTALHPIDATP